MIKINFYLVEPNKQIYSDIHNNFIYTAEGMIYEDPIHYKINWDHDPPILEFYWDENIIENDKELQKELEKMGYLTFTYYD